MNSVSDSDLLRDYAEDRSESAFAELVRRHVDLVYSAAIRMVQDAHLAEDVTQAAFVALAQNASKLTNRAVLSGWLHRTAKNLACNVVRTDVRRRAREMEAAAMNEMNEPEASWEEIAPHLDSALNELDEADRDALMLRYFERKSAREMAAILGVSDEAAQKRASRAVERLRESFAKRGVGVGAGALVIAISAHAVQAAPATLAAAISAATAGVALQSSTAVAAAKTVAMTTLQKTIIGASLVAACSAGFYGVNQNTRMRHEVHAVLESQNSLSTQVAQLQRERDDAVNRLASAKEEIAQLKQGQNPNEVLRLRGKVGSLQQQLTSAEAKSNSPSTGFAKMMGDPAMREYINQAMVEMIKRRYGPFFQELKLTPEQIDQFIQTVSGTYQQGIKRLAAYQQGNVAAAQTPENEKSDLENQLKAILGESGAARFNQYSHDLPARTTVDQLDAQLGASKLTEEQKTRLFNVVNAEPFDVTHGITGDLDKSFFGPPGQVEAYLSKISDSNQHVLQQAADFLTPEQLAALSTVLTNGLAARTIQAAAFTQKH